MYVFRPGRGDYCSHLGLWPPGYPKPRDWFRAYPASELDIPASSPGILGIWLPPLNSVRKKKRNHIIKRRISSTDYWKSCVNALSSFLLYQIRQESFNWEGGRHCERKAVPSLKGSPISLNLFFLFSESCLIPYRKKTTHVVSFGDRGQAAIIANTRMQSVRIPMQYTVIRFLRGLWEGEALMECWNISTDEK